MMRRTVEKEFYTRNHRTTDSNRRGLGSEWLRTICFVLFD